jgi:arylsulfatase
MPMLYNLRTDPFEYADITSNSYYDWILYHSFMVHGLTIAAKKFAETFKDFPPIQKPNSFTLDDAIAKMEDAQAAAS